MGQPHITPITEARPKELAVLFESRGTDPSVLLPDTIFERLATSWAGHFAHVVVELSRQGHGQVPYSELAMHTRIAGRDIQAYALWIRRVAQPPVTYSIDPELFCNWAQVLTLRPTEGVIEYDLTEGLPGEVLSWDIRNHHLELKGLRY